MDDNVFLGKSNVEKRKHFLFLVGKESVGDFERFSNLIAEDSEKSKTFIVKGLLEKMCWAFWENQSREIEHWKKIAEINFKSKEFVFLSDYINAYSVVLKCLQENFYHPENNAAKLKLNTVAKKDILEILTCLHDGGFEKTPYEIVKAQLISIFDREEAAKRFNKIIGLKDSVIEASPFEKGMHTYLSEKEIFNRPNADNLFSHSFIKSERTQYEKNNAPIVLISCDEVYFRKLAPLLALEKVAYPSIDFHIVFVASEDVARELVDEFELLEEAFAKIRNDVREKTISFSWLEAPEQKTRKNTFAACARFGVARSMIERFNRPLFIMDIDMLIQGSPAAFFEKMSLYDFSGSIPTGLMSLVPWRRIMAGSLYVANGEEGCKFLKNVENYLIAGFDKNGEWYLDQNALSYAYECLPFPQSRVFANNNEFDRPIVSREICKSLLA